MSEESKACPLCGSLTECFGQVDLFPEMNDSYRCSNTSCVLSFRWIKASVWQSRPIEDALRKQLEIAIDALKWGTNRNDALIEIDKLNPVTKE